MNKNVMKPANAIFQAENFPLLTALIVISTVLGLALSLLAKGGINYFVVGGVVGLYLAAAVTSMRQVSMRPHARMDETPKFLPWIVGLAFCLGALLFGRQFEYLSIWGDIGVYVNEAWHLRSGGTLPFPWQVQAMDIDTNAALPVPLGMVNPAGEGLWQFHALPTWPALMAISNLPNEGLPILAILFSLNVILFYFVVRDFVRDDTASAFTTLILAALPLMWHQALYATAEMLLLAIVLSTLVVSTRLGNHSFFVGSGVFAFGTVHLGVLLLAPALGIILLMAAITATKHARARLAWLGLSCAFASVFAYEVSAALSIKYTNDIAASMFAGQTYLAYVACLTPALSVIPFFLALCRFVWKLTSQQT